MRPFTAGQLRSIASSPFGMSTGTSRLKNAAILRRSFRMRPVPISDDTSVVRRAFSVRPLAARLH